VGNSSEDAEVTSPEDKDHEEDGSRIILNNKVTRGTNNNEETSEVKQTLEEDLTEDTTDLGTCWIPATML
jgi:hypothetical protein